MNTLTHIDEHGAAVMVDVHEKADTQRTAKAEGRIAMNAEAFGAIRDGAAKKGDVLAVARVAGIQAAKKNAELIPLCHNITLTDCGVDFTFEEESNSIHAICHASCVGKTGVEMEALTGASVALLTIYDMCKAVDRAMVISDIRLVEKAGGKSGEYHV